MEYPKGTKFNKWCIVLEVQRGKSIQTIRRWMVFSNGKKRFERLPAQKYRHFRSNQLDLEQFLIRLNESIPIEQRTIEAVEIKHAFISPKLLDEYQTFLRAQISNQITADCEFNYVKKYFLDFFINHEQISDPIKWHQVHKTSWANFLLSDKSPPSVSSKKQIIYSVNKFMSWLSEKRPSEVPKMIFKPLTNARLKELASKRKMNKEERQTNYIPSEDWKTINDRAVKELIPIINLCYHFGLRRNEAMGLKLSDVKTGHIGVERQLIKCNEGDPIYGVTKGRASRKIPYWFTTPAKAYHWIKEIKLMNPRTLSRLWDEFILDLMKQNLIKIEYNLHDLRHTWITRAIRQQKVPRDVQLAAGHVSINTTMGYIHDDRDLDDAPFIPESA